MCYTKYNFNIATSFLVFYDDFECRVVVTFVIALLACGSSSFHRKGFGLVA